MSYDDFLAFHKSIIIFNSYIYLYGNGNVEEQLKFIDNEYLKSFDKQDIDSTIPLQEAFDKIKEINVEYPISPDEGEQGKTFLSLNCNRPFYESGNIFSFSNFGILTCRNPCCTIKRLC